MDIKQIARAVELVELSQLHEVTIVEGRQSIRVVNNLHHNTMNPVEETYSLETSTTQNDASSDSSKAQITATYVGRIYLSEDGANDDLVSKGDQVEQGQTVCFIDELSRLLPVVSDKSGTISDILVKSGDNVEYGQAIFELKG